MISHFAYFKQTDLPIFLCEGLQPVPNEMSLGIM